MRYRVVMTFMLLAAGLVHAQQQKGWRRLVFFKHDGAEGRVAKAHIDEFKQSVRRKLIQLAPPSFSDLEVLPVLTALPPAETTRYKYMRNSDSVLLIGGAITPDQKLPIIQNEVFIGHLRGPLSRSVLLS